MNDGMDALGDKKRGYSTMECITCVFCGKSTPVKSIRSLKKGNPMTLGWLEVRACLGRPKKRKKGEKKWKKPTGGFPCISKTNLVDHMTTHKQYINQLVDLSSGIIMYIMQSRLPVEKPPVILLIEEKNREIKSLTDQVKDLTFQLGNAKGQLEDVMPELRELRESARNHRWVVDQLNEKIRQKDAMIDNLKASLQKVSWG